MEKSIDESTAYIMHYNSPQKFLRHLKNTILSAFHPCTLHASLILIGQCCFAQEALSVMGLVKCFITKCTSPKKTTLFRERGRQLSVNFPGLLATSVYNDIHRSIRVMKRSK